MDIHPRLIPMLYQIDFGNRYKSLCERHSDRNNKSRKYDRNKIQEFYEGHGLKVSFVKSESFFKVLEVVGPFKVQFNTIPDAGFLQFVLDVKKGNERYDLSLGVWETIASELLNYRIEVRKPFFGSYEELEEILKEVLSIYEDFRHGLSAIEDTLA